MPPLRDRVKARLAAAFAEENPRLLRSPEAADDARDLFLEAMPSPEHMDVEVLLLVYTTFRMRAVGQAPSVERDHDLTIARGARDLLVSSGFAAGLPQLVDAGLGTEDHPGPKASSLPEADDAVATAVRSLIVLVSNHGDDQRQSVNLLVDQLTAAADAGDTPLSSEARFAISLVEVFVTCIAQDGQFADHQVERFSAALAAVPADNPNRHTYAAVQTAALELQTGTADDTSALIAALSSIPPIGDVTGNKWLRGLFTAFNQTLAEIRDHLGEPGDVSTGSMPRPSLDDYEGLLEQSAWLSDAEESAPPRQATRMAIIHIVNHIGSYMGLHDVSHRDAALELARRLRATALENSDSESLLEADIALIMVETLGPAGSFMAGDLLSDELIERCRATTARCPYGHQMFPQAVMATVQALLRRAWALRPSDPTQTWALATEAMAWLDQLDRSEQPMMSVEPLRQWADFLRGGPIPDMDALRAEQGPVIGSIDEMSRGLNALYKSVATDPEGARRELRNPAIPVWNRAKTAVGLAGHLLSGPSADPALALTFAEDAVGIMAQLTRRDSDPRTTGHGLLTFDGTIRMLIDIALGPGGTSAELLQRAAVLFERGRGLVLAQLVEGDADLESLRDTHPVLAQRLTEKAAGFTTGSSARDKLANLRTSRDIDAFVADIRRLPGLEDFQNGPSAVRIMAAAQDGPIIFLIHGVSSCRVLAVRAADVVPLRLDVNPERLTESARRFQAAVGTVNAPGAVRPAPATIIEAAETIREILSWTWHHVTGPVLRALGITDQVADGARWPRVWWVPSGSFSALPLHAAECSLSDCPEASSPSSGCGSALDTCVSSYTPSVRVLLHSRRNALKPLTATDGLTAGSSAAALIIAESDDDLPGAESAAHIAAERLGAGTPLIGPNATRERVLEALATSEWVHFGCHAVSDAADPLGSHVQLPGGEQLLVTDIFQARSATARLAFLSGCGTAQTSEQQADEAVHLASAFLVAGYPQAVGTLWEVESRRAGRVVRDFYERLGTTTDRVQGDSASVAVVLHHVVRALRDAYPNRPQDWAAYLHAGI